MNTLIESNRRCDKRIVFISDLHFDYVGNSKQDENSEKTQLEFFNFIKDHYRDDVLLLGGDFYDDPYKTLEFVQEMERNQLFGFFVLGNHDYWNNGTLGYDEIITLFTNETSNNLWFRFLTTGTKYYIDDLCFIGDTGWTSFQRTVNRNEENKHGRQVVLKQFMSLPEATKVLDFSPQKIRDLHNQWIEFANDILQREQKVIILTHFPMIDLTDEDKDCWWSSRTKLLETENQWRIFGHTHNSDNFGHTFNISKQRGYHNKITKDKTDDLYNEIKKDYIKQQIQYTESLIADGNLIATEKWRKTAPKINKKIVNERFRYFTQQYFTSEFGILHKVSTRRELSVPFQYAKSEHYTATLVSDNIENNEYSISVKRCGYKRCSSNISNFGALMFDKRKYIKKVQEKIKEITTLDKIRIGYCYFHMLKRETIETLISATNYLKNTDIVTDVRSFITAAIITGYAWSGKLYELEQMRPVNDYDIARFYLQFITMKTYGIPFWDINKVIRSKEDKIAFGNIELWLPTVNDKQLTIEQAMNALSQTPLIEHVNPNGNKVACQSCGHVWESSDKKIIRNCEYCTKQQIIIGRLKRRKSRYIESLPPEWEQ